MSLLRCVFLLPNWHVAERFCSVEVDVRWSGNKVLIPNTGGLTVHEFIKAHTAGSQGFFYDLGRVDKSRKDTAPPLTIDLELYIDKIAVCVFIHSTFFL